MGDTSARQIILNTTNMSPYVGLLLTITIRDGVTDRTENRLPLPKLSSININIRFPPPKLPPGVVAQNKILIMPLGSTLTKGVDEFPGSYRKQVHQALSKQGFDVDFVGTKVTNRFPGMDPHHEGTPDKFITFFTRFAEFWLDKIENPDVILLHAGIFDFVRDVDLANTPNRYDDLIKELGRLRPYTRIIATNLISKKGTQLHDDIQTYFNPFIEEVVKKNADSGILVNYLDIASFVNDSDVDEKTLLNQKGYDDMGNGWVSAITKYFNTNGDKFTRPNILSLDIPSVSKNEVTVTFSKPVSDITAVKISNYELTATGGTITINNSVLDQYKRIVTLFTSSLDAFKGQFISLRIRDIVDRVGNRIYVANETILVPIS